MEKKTKITYRRVGNYFIPNLIIQPEESNISLYKWGMMNKTYLEKHKKILFNTLLIQGNLYQHCAEVEKQARDMFDALVEEMKKTEGLTEQLKEQNQLEWVHRMERIQQFAREIIRSEIINH